jgi:hypothetical protein
MVWLIAASGAASGEGILAWVSALSDVTSCLVVAIGVVIALGQLRAASRQREDELKGDRTQTTLDYINQFRQTRYLIAWDVDASGRPTFLEYSIFWCMDALVSVRAKKPDTLTSVEGQCIGICANFVVSIANLLSYDLANKDLLIETFAGQVAMVDDVLALPVYAGDGFMRNLRQDKDYLALVKLARAQVALLAIPVAHTAANPIA